MIRKICLFIRLSRGYPMRIVLYGHFKLIFMQLPKKCLLYLLINRQLKYVKRLKIHKITSRTNEEQVVNQNLLKLNESTSYLKRTFVNLANWPPTSKSRAQANPHKAKNKLDLRKTWLANMAVNNYKFTDWNYALSRLKSFC